MYAVSEYVDCLVIGESVAGYAAALEMASAGRSARFIYTEYDGGVEMSMMVGTTGVNDLPMFSTDWTRRVIQTLPQSDAAPHHYSGFTFLGHDVDAGVMAFTGRSELLKESRLLAKSVIFAPYGVEPTFLPKDNLSVPSHSIYSQLTIYDAVSVKGERVAVVGCGYRALERTRFVAAYRVESVTLLCSESAIESDTELLMELQQMPQVNICLNTKIKAILGEPVRQVQIEPKPGVSGTIFVSDKLRGVVVDHEGQERVLDVVGIFPADNPVVDWSLWGDRARAVEMIKQGKIVLAGLAAGVDYADDAALFADGVRAARSLLL